MGNSGKRTVLMSGYGMPMHRAIALALHVASLPIGSVLTVDMAFPDSTSLPNTMSKIIMHNVKDATGSKVAKGKFTKKRLTKGMVPVRGQDWKF